MKLKLFRLFIALIILTGMMYSCSKPTAHRPFTPKPIPVPISEKTDKTEETNQKEEIAVIPTEIPSHIPVETPSETKIDVPEKKTTVMVNLPQVNREFRAAWIATVANINWPSKRNLSTEEQKAEAIYLLDLLKENNFNAVIFQARPSADALYDSPYEPWSYFLTEETGKAPQPYYDPLQFWTEEAHKRGLELHVWLNPYRAHHSNGGSVSSRSMVHKMPNNMIRLKNGMYWFDPADPATQDHVSKIVKDIVKRYDIDGIHFDDYFYPYASYNGGADFPDHATWNAYVKSGGKLSRADWRRDNVNKFIQRIYNEIKAEKHFVKFGISPFGIWKPGVPNGISGMSQYDELYADAKLWLNEGWIDYFTPQLYWPVDSPRQNFATLLQWWESENTFKRHLWPGLNTVEIKAADKAGEILRQIELTRRLVPNSAGVAHWSMAGLNSVMLNSLKSGPYKEKALIPKSPWLQPLISGKPALSLSEETHRVLVNWTYNEQNHVSHWLLYKRYGETWETEILNSNTTVQVLERQKNGKKLDMVVIQAVDRLGNESEYEVAEVRS